MFIFERPFAAVLAAMSSSVLFIFIDFLLRHVA